MFTLKKNSLNIKFEHLPSWLAVTGHILPRNDEEMHRFEKLYSDYNSVNSINELDFDKIWNDEDQFPLKDASKIIEIKVRPLRMAARSLNSLSDKIRAKMKENQESNE